MAIEHAEKGKIDVPYGSALGGKHSLDRTSYFANKVESSPFSWHLMKTHESPSQ